MISIIIPTLNEERYLPRLLESITEQDYQGEIEIIVADNKSKDKTREIAKSFGCRIVDGGLPPKARNEGAKVANANFFLFLDADGFLPKDFITKAMKEFLNRELGVAGFFCIPDDNAFIFRLVLGIYNFWLRSTEKFSGYGGNAIFIKRDIHEKINGFNESVKFAEDHLYVRTAREFGKCGVIKGTHSYMNMRRFKEQGVLKTSLKCIFAGLHLFIFGPIKKDIFKYKFDHYENLPR
ncbi:glycosyltransferase [Patescibacteria group bacterium]|nr:glycosyltransferase [Patescibacteria group bacterium]MBU4022941.1 glycosyltransferase [Patescibacteria group bacterium]MBU4078285.1 glycosyltransferase [Patescibacteria group bacterium]